MRAMMSNNETVFFFFKASLPNTFTILYNRTDKKTIFLLTNNQKNDIINEEYFKARTKWTDTENLLKIQC